MTTDLQRRRNGCFTTESDAVVPPGWVEVQCDDHPDFLPEEVHRFDEDLDAGLWVSLAARFVNVDTGETVSPEVTPDGVPQFPSDLWRGVSVRVIVPIIDAIERGVATSDACLVCGSEYGDCDHLEEKDE